MGIIRGSIITVLLSGLFCAAPGAQESPQDNRQFSSAVGQPVSAAAENIRQNNFAAALSDLSSALAVSERTPYETSVIYQMQGSVLYELDRAEDALESFRNALSGGGLDAREMSALKLQMAQIRIVLGQYALGADELEAWQKQGGALTPELREMLLSALVQSEQFDRALPYALAWYQDAGAARERRHFDLMNMLYYKTGRRAEQTEIVKDMIERWPADRGLWENLASLYAEAEQDDDAFAVNQLMYAAGFFETEADILKLVQYYGYNNIPYQGAQILKRELNRKIVGETAANLKTLADLWLQARAYDKAAPVLIRLTEISPDKLTFAQLAETYISQGDCDAAEINFGNAVELGYPSGKPMMLIGTCRYESAQLLPKPTCEMSPDKRKLSDRFLAQNRAKESFAKVSSPARLRNDAESWIEFIGREQSLIDEQCENISKITEIRCFADIQIAYDNMFLNDGKFELSDPKCEVHKTAFDAEYMQKAPID